MFSWLFGKKTQARLGIDLGSSAIKIAELNQKDGRPNLINYALAQTKEEAPFRLGEIKEEELSAVLKTLITEAKIQSKRACISLPVNKTFSTVMEMPAMSEKELVAAIPFEAQKYVPVPIDEVVLDWVVVSRKEALTDASKSSQESTGKAGDETVNETKPLIQVLIVAVPKETINRLTKIAKLADLEISSLEQESFSLARSLIGNDKGVYLIIDLGRKSTDLIVVNEGLVKMSHNLDTINREAILMEIDRIVNIYQMRYNRRIEQCLLTGGRASEKELVSFLTEKLKIPIKIANPFARVGYPVVLNPALGELGALLAVAIGLAMREN